MHQKKSISRHTHAEDVNILLATLPWGIDKCGVSNSEPIHTLWRYLGPHFTMGSHQNDLLEILHSHVAADPDLIVLKVLCSPPNW
jgi:hypothetical protein